MSDIFIAMIMSVLIVIFALFSALFNILVTMVRAGGNTSKLSMDIFKRKSDKDEALSAKIPEANTVKEVNDSIKRWRTFAGILFSLVMLFLLASVWRVPLSGFFPWAMLLAFFRASPKNGWPHYVFWPLLSATIIVLILLWKKEQTFFRK